MDSTRFDESRWPVVLITTPPYILDESAFLQYVDRLSSYHDRGEMFGFIFDVRQSPAMPADQRRLIAERIDRDAAYYGRRCPCALVVSTPLQRGVVKVVMWLLRDPHPVEVFITVEAAEAWMRDYWALKGQAPAPSKPKSEPPRSKRQSGGG